MWYLLLALSSLADMPPVFEPMHEAGDCAFSRSAPQDDGFPILRAECVWPELAPEQLDRALGDWGGHQLIWSMVHSSHLIEQRETDALVVHVHTAPVMVDREILLRMWVEDVPGGRAYRWSQADPQPPAHEGRMGVDRDDGSYTILAEDEGVRVIATLHYDPGGSIPDSMVRWFQVLGLPRFLEELRIAAEDQETILD